MSLGTRMMLGAILVVFGLVGLITGPDRAGALIALVLLAAGAAVIYAAWSRGQGGEGDGS